MPHENVKDFSNRKKDVKKNRERYRSQLDWNDLVKEISIDNFFNSYWPNVVMPMEGYQEMAKAFGIFLRNIEVKKRHNFEVQKLDFSNEVIHGCIEDA